MIGHMPFTYDILQVCNMSFFEIVKEQMQLSNFHFIHRSSLSNIILHAKFTQEIYFA